MTNPVIDNTTGGNLDRVILWQYDHADNLISIIELFSQFFKDSTTDFFDEYVKKFNLSNPDEVTDYGLAVWGKVLDIPRPTLTYTDGGEKVTRPMSKELYRRILAGRIILSEKNASVPAYIEYVTSVFGDGVTVIDGQDMSLSFVKNESAETPLTAEAIAAISQYPDVVFAYPSGVRSNERSNDPMFALDGQQTDTDDTDPIAGGLDESGFNWRITPKGNWR